MRSLLLLVFLLINAVGTFTAAVYKVTGVKTHLNIRSGPGTNYKKVGELNLHDVIYVTSISDGWAKFYKGYVSTNYLTIGTKCDRSQHKTTGKLSFRSGPSTNYDIVNTFEKGTTVNYYGRDPFTKSWAVTGKGYINANKLSLPVQRGPDKEHLTKKIGRFTYCKNQVETYYNLKMDGVINIMRNLGYEEKDGWKYWVNKDGCKMFGDYIMIAANLDVHPRGSFVETSLGTAIVCDTGAFAANNKNQVDIAVNW